jgi:hypothetical protein
MERKEDMRKLYRLEVILAVVLVALFVAMVPMVKAADPAHVNGVWDLTVESPNGTSTPVATFKQDGETLTGTYKGRRGETDLKGTIKDNDIHFTTTISFQGQDLVLDYTATVDGDTMKGKVKFGEMAEGTFSGKKRPEDAPVQK